MLNYWEELTLASHELAGKGKARSDNVAVAFRRICMRDLAWVVGNGHGINVRADG
jgi:hypothetical protein